MLTSMHHSLVLTADFRNPSVRSISENPTIISCTTSGLPHTSVTLLKLTVNDGTFENAGTFPSILQNRSTSMYSSFLTINDSGLFGCFVISIFSIHQNDGILIHTQPSSEPSEFRESCKYQYFMCY